MLLFKKQKLTFKNQFQLKKKIGKIIESNKKFLYLKMNHIFFDARQLCRLNKFAINNVRAKNFVVLNLLKELKINYNNF